MEHRKYLAYNADEFIKWAQSVGEHTTRAVNVFLSQGREPEQGYKSCASLTKLGDRYGHGRLEKACERVFVYTTSPSIRNISIILKNGQDKVQANTFTLEVSTKGHGITCGAAYFQREGARL